LSGGGGRKTHSNQNKENKIQQLQRGMGQRRRTKEPKRSRGTVGLFGLRKHCKMEKELVTREGRIGQSNVGPHGEQEVDFPMVIIKGAGVEFVKKEETNTSGNRSNGGEKGSKNQKAERAGEKINKKKQNRKIKRTDKTEKRK